ncbi:TRAP transporter small permease [Pusillimonas noertemannii]|uniref:TRAP transporter small permease protein n=1 Tax=Pusillimonas noertemannii TaxID=305977 RepID=A0A2U1CPM5_9BURK|nr:TRAP transporter small permease [Pusillimonas noertemannii]PVY67829.1 TRAP-type C4-dicarboxylate transport system permease small subunit [Pusillimonas noertemannii]TFL12645.1 TRAP transporter small permease [Pusillimonas noertemannii]
MKSIDRVVAWVTSGLHFVATLMLVGIVVVNAANVIGRYIFNRPAETADELMIFMLTIAVFLCLPRCTNEDAHIRMNLLRDRISGKARKVWDLLLELLHFGLAAFVVYVGAPSVAQLFSWGQVSEAAKIPMWIVHSVIPLGFALACVIILLSIVRLLRGWGRP